MATKTFYFLNTTATAPNWFGSMQDGGSAPAAILTSGGAQPGKTAVTTPFFRCRWGATAKGTVASASSYIAGTSGPTKGTGAASTTSGDSYVTPSAYTGTFAAGAWTIDLSMRTQNVTTTGRMRMRVWASVNADGTSARELTSSVLVGQINTMSSTTITYAGGITWSPGAITLNNEFLFFQIEWEETTAGTNNGSNVGLYISIADITTTDFALGDVSGTLADTDDIDTASFPSAIVEWQGSFAPIEVVDTASFLNAVVDWQGSFAPTDDDDVAAIAGQVLAAGVSGTFDLIESTADSFASSGPITGTFFDPSRTAARITLSNSNLTATRAS